MTNSSLAAPASYVERLVLALYRLITWGLAPLVRTRLQRRAMQEPLYGQLTGERFGSYTQPSSQGWVWVHAVSLGETHAAAVLLRELRVQLPGMKLLLTHGTATGRTEGAKLLQSGDVQVWQPWDSVQATQHFFEHFKPSIGIVMETEVWPQLCAAAQLAGVPLVLANARLNVASAAKAQRLRALSRPAYASFAQVLAQTQADAQRLQAAGAQHVHTVGNLKFDAALDAHVLAQGKRLRAASAASPIVMLASSREGEEALFLDQIKALAATSSARSATDSIASDVPLTDHKQPIQWLIVPRHPQRFDGVQVLCEQRGLSVSRRSCWLDAPQAADVWLGDSMGEMSLYYALADVALLGGSFEPLGGQNLIEAIDAGCPVVMGPHTFNFEEASSTAEQIGAALRASDMREAMQLALRAARQPSDAQLLQQRGQEWLKGASGAAKRMAQLLADVMAATQPSSAP